jgi:hypothetical protein
VAEAGGPGVDRHAALLPLVRLCLLHRGNVSAATAINLPGLRGRLLNPTEAFYRQLPPCGVPDHVGLTAWLQAAARSPHTGIRCVLRGGALHAYAVPPGVGGDAGAAVAVEAAPIYQESVPATPEDTRLVVTRFGVGSNTVGADLSIGDASAVERAAALVEFHRRLLMLGHTNPLFAAELSEVHSQWCSEADCSPLPRRLSSVPGLDEVMVMLHHEAAKPSGILGYILQAGQFKVFALRGEAAAMEAYTPSELSSPLVASVPGTSPPSGSWSASGAPIADAVPALDDSPTPFLAAIGDHISGDNTVGTEDLVYSEQVLQVVKQLLHAYARTTINNAVEINGLLGSLLNPGESFRRQLPRPLIDKCQLVDLLEAADAKQDRGIRLVYCQRKLCAYAVDNL